MTKQKITALVAAFAKRGVKARSTYQGYVLTDVSSVVEGIPDWMADIAMENETTVERNANTIIFG